MFLIKNTKLAQLVNILYEFYYVFINSYRLKIKKNRDKKSRYVFLAYHHAHACLLGIHGDQEFFI